MMHDREEGIGGQAQQELQVQLIQKYLKAKQATEFAMEKKNHK